MLIAIWGIPIFYMYYLKKCLKNRLLLFDVKETIYFCTGPKGNIGNTGTYRK